MNRWKMRRTGGGSATAPSFDTSTPTKKTLSSFMARPSFPGARLGTPERSPFCLQLQSLRAATPETTVITSLAVTLPPVSIQFEFVSGVGCALLGG